MTSGDSTTHHTFSSPRTIDGLPVGHRPRVMPKRDIPARRPPVVVRPHHVAVAPVQAVSHPAKQVKPKPFPSHGKVMSDVGRSPRRHRRYKAPLQQKWQMSATPVRPAEPVVHEAMQQLATHPAQTPVAETQAQPTRKRRWLSWLSTLGIIVGAMVLGVFSQFLPFGQAFIVLYLLLAVVLKIKSSTTFILALISLFSMVLLMVKGSSEVAGTYAVYTFWLIAIGTLSVFLEVRRQNTRLAIHK